MAVATLADQPERAVHLFAAGNRVQDSFGAADDVPPVERDLHRHLATGRELLGEAAFDAAWAFGWAMSQDEAVAYALHGSSQVVHSAHAQNDASSSSPATPGTPRPR